MTSNRDIQKLFDQWNPNKVKAGDRVQVNIDTISPYPARVVGLARLLPGEPLPVLPAGQQRAGAVCNVIWDRGTGH